MQENIDSIIKNVKQEIQMCYGRIEDIKKLNKIDEDARNSWLDEYEERILKLNVELEMLESIK